MSPVDDGGRVAEDEYEQRIESTDSSYEGENPAFFRREWRRDKKWAEMRLK